MSSTDERPVIVTGEQHTHPSLRLLARACIALAQQQLADEQAQADLRQDDGAQPDGCEHEADNG